MNVHPAPDDTSSPHTGVGPSAGQILPPDALANRLAEVYLVLGPIYRRVSRIVEQDGERSGIPTGVRAVLAQLLRDGERTVPQIAREQDLSRQFVQRMADEALAAGLIERHENPAHRRSWLLRLTDAGRERIGQVLASEHERMGRVGGDLTGEDLEATLKVLRSMLAALGDVERG